MKVGNTLQLSPQISDSDTDKKLTYINLTSNIISVSGSGLVTAKNIGTGKIIVREENSGAQIEYTINVVDSEPPVISVNPSSSDWVKNINVRINVTDNKNELNNNNKYQYQLSTSNSTPTGTWQDYKNGTAFTIGSGLTGNYYLWVKQVSDIDDNISQQGGTKVGNYHVFGPYAFDNTALKSCSITPSTSNWTNADVTLTGTAQDIGSGIVAFGWTTEPKEPTGTTTTGELGKWTSITTTTAEIRKTITLSGNGTRYFWAKDAVGNINSSSYTISKIDKLAPNAFTPTATSTLNSITVTASTTDQTATTSYAKSGIAGYRFRINSGSWTAYQTSGTYTFTGLSQGTSYSVEVQAKDNAGNTKTGSVTIKTKLENKLLIDVANIGDYVDYPISYTSAESFCAKTSTYTGWRVLYKYGDCVWLVSAGCPLVSGGDSLSTIRSKMLNTANFNTYKNSTYANGVRTLKKEDLDYYLGTSINTTTIHSDTIIKTGGWYYLPDYYDSAQTKLWCFDGSNNNFYCQGAQRGIGIRVVVHLKSDVRTTGQNSSSVWQLTTKVEAE